MGTFGVLVVFLSCSALSSFALRLGKDLNGPKVTCLNGEFYNGTCRCYPGASGSDCATIVHCNDGGDLTADRNGLAACSCYPGFEPFSNCYKLACTNGAFEWLSASGEILDSPFCQCRTGFRGQYCTEIEYCQHGGKITEQNGCICPPNTRGERCEQITCENGGTPISSLSLCQCPPWATGVFCEVATACQHGLLNQVSGKCDCDTGYTGSACHLRDCQNGDQVGDRCNCHGLFTGDLCSEVSKCTNATISGDRTPPCNCTDDHTGLACEKPKCQNGGTPLIASDGTVSCNCPTFTTGELCQFELVCFNGGTFYKGNRTCLCAAGYSGYLCDQIDCGSGHEFGAVGSRDTLAYYCDLTKCDLSNLPSTLDSACLDTCQTKCDCVDDYDSDDNCHSILKCWDHGVSYSNGTKYCKCQAGYHGRLCEYIDCQHGHRRVSIVNSKPSASCECDPKYTGKMCDTILCLNGGTPSADGSSCNCPAHYSGPQCEIIRCVYGRFQGGKCQCDPGVTGTACETILECYHGGVLKGDQCQCQFPALPVSTCYRLACQNLDYRPVVVGVQSQCDCEDPFRGDLCGEVKYCANGGTYNSDNGGCYCPDGFTGYACELHNCINGYFDRLNEKCVCPDWAEGILCEKVTQCLHGGTFYSGGYCLCPHPYTGVACQERLCIHGRYDLQTDICTCSSLYQGSYCAEPKNCLNGGSFASHGVCKCPDPFTGDACEELDCGYNGVSHVTGSQTVCLCDNLFTGPFCNQTKGCMNGGSIRPDGSCRCTGSFSGPNCDLLSCQHGQMLYVDRNSRIPVPYCDVDHCDFTNSSSIGQSCLGTCTTQCLCDRGYKGDVCDVLFECHNGGTFFENNSTCVCPPGFEGSVCQFRHCEHGGTPLGEGACACRPGYIGAVCQTPLCKYGRPNSVDPTVCDCDPGATGELCDTILNCLEGGRLVRDQCQCRPPQLPIETCGIPACQHGHLTLNQTTMNTYYCTCDKGYGGRICSEVYGCLNGGTRLTNSTCVCADHFSGHVCEVGDCQNGGFWLGNSCRCQSYSSGSWCEQIVACLNGGTLAGGKCSCPAGYKGNACEQKDCKNGHTHGTSDQVCHCDGDYFTGDLCQTALYCLNGGTLQDGGNCKCPSGYIGDACEKKDCQHGFSVTTGNSSRCQCDPFYWGPLCSRPHRCFNGGTLFQLMGGSYCRCASPYSGPLCQNLDCRYGHQIASNAGDGEPLWYLNLDYCPAPNTKPEDISISCAKNSATYCYCYPGWTGVQCDLLDFCLHGGTLVVNPDGSRTCSCTDDYTDPYCATPVCRNGGVHNGITCVCPDHFDGDRCQNIRCVYGRHDTSDFTQDCKCEAGVSGKACETIDRCFNGGKLDVASNRCFCLPPLAPYGSCSYLECQHGRSGDTINNVTLCNCDLGYGGDICSEVDFCLNGGTFSNGVCSCPTHYSGEVCQTAACFSGYQSTTTGKCVCPTWATGTFCETVLSCQNFGTLNPVTHRCSCEPGFTGIGCEKLNCAIDHGHYSESSRRCICQHPYSGRLCEQIDECLNGGVQGVGGICSCPEHYSGDACEYLDCGKNGQTVEVIVNNTFAGLKCLCNAFWTGDKCDAPQGCFNGGSLLSTGKCGCVAPYTGDLCDQHDCKNGHLIYSGGHTHDVFYHPAYYCDPSKCNLTNSQSMSAACMKTCGTFCACNDGYQGTECDRLAQCFNGGTLQSNNSCSCAPNFTGNSCKVPICQNGGSASNGRCTCPDNYSGRFCELPACRYGHRNPEDLKKCICDPGATGTACETIEFCTMGGTLYNNTCQCAPPQLPIKTCAELACQHGTQYGTGPYAFCSCTLGYGGKLCTDISWCGNGGSIRENNTCSCTADWSGDTCNVWNCNEGHLQSGVCICPDWATGRHCESAKECQNGGSRQTDGSCRCTPDWTGLACHSKNCRHGNYDEAANACVCDQFYEGALCDQPYHCYNNGYMSSGRCVCPAPFTGGACETLPCAHGVSVIYNGVTRCLCERLFTGQLCDRAKGCLNGGALQADGSCLCVTPYSGPNCDLLDCSEHGHLIYDSYPHDVPIFYCDPKFCNGSNGIDGDNPAACISHCKTSCWCSDNYGGTQCDAVKKCGNGGTFVDLGTFSYCVCPTNFHGPTCEFATCQHGGTALGTYCSCPRYFYGQFCERVICVHGYSDPDSGYTKCICEPGAGGDACEQILYCENGKLINGDCQCTPPYELFGSCARLDCQHGRLVYSGNSSVCECGAGLAGPVCTEIEYCHHGGAYDAATGTCKCQPNYTGEVCETGICLNGGYWSSYSQQCYCPLSGISGDFCEIVSKCQNGGTLINGFCHCPPDYTGVECESLDCHGRGYYSVFDNKCYCYRPYGGRLCDEPSYCMNGGTQTTANHCDCPKGFSGAACEHKNCLYGNSYMRNDTVSTCTCSYFYTGDFCDQSRGCLNGGSILANGSCGCVAPYEGHVCETVSTCQHGHMLLESEYDGNVVTSFYCDLTLCDFSDPPNSLDAKCLKKCQTVCWCDESFTGTSCDQLNGCQNGGTFAKGACQCPTGFGGPACNAIVCQNGGSAERHRCSCPPGFRGQFCEDLVCKYGRNDVSDPTKCVCDQGVSGTACDHIDNCLNGGTLINNTCECQPPFLPFGSCADLACQHGTVNNFRPTSTCSCKTGFAGRICSEKSYCLNGGTQLSSSNCLCDPFHTGEVCEDLICQNGGIYSESGRRCQCNQFSTGPLCETTIKCFNGGELVEDGVCYCQPGYDGNACQNPICTHGYINAQSECVCDPLYYGPHCKQPIDCLNNGTGYYTGSGPLKLHGCVCKYPFIGDACEDLPCVYGHATIDGGQSKCLCDEFHTGQLCDQQKYCVNGGTLLPNGQCLCLDNFGGSACEQLPCRHGHMIHSNRRSTHTYPELYCDAAKCSADPTSLACFKSCESYCQCDEGYGAPLCNRLISCRHGGNLTTSADGDPICDCPDSYEGRVCEKRVCDNGGTPQGDNCLCPLHFYGRVCEKVICQYGISTGPDRTACECEFGVTGKACDQVVSCLFGDGPYHGVCTCQPPYENSGSCRRLACQRGGYFDRQFNCVCGPGYTGILCTELEYCQNGGTLVNGVCQCQKDFTGPVCERYVCQHDGYYSPFTERCHCPIETRGTFCETIVSCQNGGVLQANGQCLCKGGFSGDVCEKFNCGHGVWQSGSCRCNQGYTGTYCDRPAYCLNGGTFLGSGGLGRCHCSPPFQGVACENLPCANGGTSYIVGGTNETRCACGDFFVTGLLCQSRRGCLNGGVLSADGSNCTCNNGAVGLACDMRQCQHGRMIYSVEEYNQVGYYCDARVCDYTNPPFSFTEDCLSSCKTYCQCDYGWGGLDCDSLKFCLHGQLVGGVCQCQTGWTGPVCKQRVCSNGGSTDGDKCNCPRDYYGDSCEFVHCQYGHHITPNDPKSKCVCDTGVTGATCDTVQSCTNGGTFVNNTCTCQPPFQTSGSCAHLICQHGRLATGSDGKEFCNCQSGYSGVLCSDIDECLNGGDLEADQCRCLPGFTGDVCDVAICQESSEWNPAADSCRCPWYATGRFCETPLFCFNGGHLVNSPAKGIICDCPARYRGLVCLEDNCVNGDWIGYRCKCPPGYQGRLCEEVVACQNGGTGPTNGQCQCPSPYNGPACDNLHCQNGGVLTVADTGYTFCQCQHFFEGQLCEVPRVCFNGGTVQADGTCKCAGSYHGLQCDLLPCAHGHMIYIGVNTHENPALYCDHSKCDLSDLPSSVTPSCAQNCNSFCQCQLGYTGGLCDSLSHCFNGGTLVGGTGGTCSCPAGFSGDLCQFQLCENGYSHLIGNYSSACQCNPGFQVGAGGKCVDVDECGGHQLPPGCPTGGPVHCVNTIGSYICMCRAGYYSPNGTHCILAEASFNASVTIDNLFDNELNDPASDEYRNLSVAIKEALDPLYFATFQMFFTGVQVNRFYTDPSKKIIPEIIVDFATDRVHPDVVMKVYTDYITSCGSTCFRYFSLVTGTGRIVENNQCDYTCPFTTDCVYETHNSTRLVACNCKNGYYPITTIPGDVQFQVCNDIDECKETPHICGNQICVNTIGGYTCEGTGGTEPQISTSTVIATSTAATSPATQTTPTSSASVSTVITTPTTTVTSSAAPTPTTTTTTPSSTTPTTTPAAATTTPPPTTTTTVPSSSVSNPATTATPSTVSTSLPVTQPSGPSSSPGSEPPTPTTPSTEPTVTGTSETQSTDNSTTTTTTPEANTSPATTPTTSGAVATVSGHLGVLLSLLMAISFSLLRC